ncbi:trypsin-like peptidase domain-containing protein [Planktomarina temperata]|nr:trypsin-like peptidase domain-containing protein [Planktomarina temperata]
MANKLVILFIVIATSICSAAQSQNLVGFDRGSFGSIVLSQAQSAGSDLQLELSIGSYENEPIINYQGTIFAEIGRSVGRLDVLTDKGLFPCTAFIVSKKYILTNYHCSLGLLDNEKIGATRIEATQFVAGYVQTGIDEGTNKFTVVPIPVEYSEKLDYAVLEVIGNPSQDYGELKLASMVPNDRTPFWVIGHPQGKGQHISREKCRASSPAVSKTKLLHTCDTLPGNSGSPVIDAGLQVVVALHHAGIANDSVNAAILMSKILENSKVLAAYRAPNAAPKEEPKPNKTVEITACDALYSAASEARACFAYEAYFESCRGHSLAPIAEGYINEFCQPQETAKVDPQSTQTCSQNAELCGDEQICSIAAVNGQWNTSSVDLSHVKEAKKRSLDCGVEAIVTKVCSNAAPHNCTPQALCNAANAGGGGTSIYKQEAQKRGLNCRVSEVKPCSASSATGCTAIAICDGATYDRAGIREWLGDVNLYVKEAKKRSLDCGVEAIVTKVCSNAAPHNCTPQALCNAANAGGGGTSIYKQEAQKRGLTCGVTTSRLKIAFKNESVLRRKQLQYALKKLNYYKSTIDALYGPGTEKALTGYAKAKGININNPERVFKSVLSQVSVPSSFKSAANKPELNSGIKYKPALNDNRVLCRFATTSRGKWSGAHIFEPYVKEAKKRGLTCGVK